ncbi:MAG: TatD family hydrolase [Candidatus Hydrogenedentes bacterium]|nr:TatD family hydrolase [Candidatus Hydrogenedentota bacterium]
MRLVDTHCHLHDAAFDEDRDAVAARAMDSLEWIVLIGDSLASSRAALSFTNDRTFAAVGVHPYHPEEMDGDGVSVLRELAGHPRTVAIGEIGLDYYKHNTAPRELQHRAFHEQLSLAAELDLPLVIHNRDANEDTLAILGEHTIRAVVMHCFSGDAAFAKACLARGYYISFAGNVTYPKAIQLREAASVVPIDRLLVETDSPYLAPQPVRGKRCEPAFAAHTAAALAELKNMPLDAFAEATTANASRVFVPHFA